MTTTNPERTTMAEFEEAAPPDPSDRPARTPVQQIEDMNAFIDDMLAEIGISETRDEMTIARAIRSLRRRADRLPPVDLYDSIPLFGYELITRERIRQITQEGWSEEHDDEHTDHSLAIVAAMYAVAGVEDIRVIDDDAFPEVPDAWPASWAEEYDKRDEHPRLRCLAIAGALIAAEIDRLQRWADRNEKAEAKHIRETLAADAASDL